MTGKEIARLAGVSVSTVSIVLNGKPGVSEETRTLILNVLERNGISVNSRDPAASGGGVIRFCKIAKHGQIVNERHNSFISDYTDGIIEEAKLHGMSVEVTVFNGTSIRSISEMIRMSYGLTGCIILGTELSLDDIKEFNHLDIPIVFIDAMYEFSPHDFVTMDNRNMTFDMVSHLQKMGHTKIGLLYGIGCSNFDQRKAAFIQALSHFEIPFREDWAVKIGATQESAQADMFQWLQGKPELPTAFYACNDMIAVGAIAALQSLGYRVPADISISGFDDIPVASFVDPLLTTITVPKFEIGRLSVSVLLDKVKRPNAYRSKKCVVAGELLIRQSTSPLL